MINGYQAGRLVGARDRVRGCVRAGRAESGGRAVTAALAARQAREEAFERGMTSAGELLRAELFHADLRAARYPQEAAEAKHAAWLRYGDTAQRVGEAYRAAMLAGLDLPPGVDCLSLRYVHVPDMTGANWAYPHSVSEQFTDMAAYQARVIELAAAANVQLDSTFMHRS